MLIRWAGPVVLATSTLARSTLSFLPADVASKPQNTLTTARSPEYTAELFGDTLDALGVMQDAYFEPWVGTWPTAIDWTAAVLGSYVAGALLSLSQGLEISQHGAAGDYWVKDNVISLYFTQIIGFYFGQNAFSLRQQAYDDMLWVVLGWLDTIQFIDQYSTSRRQTGPKVDQMVRTSTLAMAQNRTWHGNLWTPAFSHRARIFWELASKGWDDKLCGGGMTWNPRLKPYKNAVTNELFISASISMYLYFPGDQNASPFDFTHDEPPPLQRQGPMEWHPHDAKYLVAAMNGYRWIVSSNMTNSQGLFTDGFHIRGYPDSGNTKCDQRDEMVYTYNQGVLLSGQLELFRVTSDISYLRDGHKLIQNVIRATGYSLERDAPVDNYERLLPGQLPPWHGLGRAGILEDVCDVGGGCSQNAQTFKGIWMHHFTAFCSPLKPVLNPDLRKRFDTTFTIEDVNREHMKACRRYIGWLQHNAMAARGTRNSEGKFGMWWTVGLLNLTGSGQWMGKDAVPEQTPKGAADYRNYGIPHDGVWVAKDPVESQKPPVWDTGISQKPLGRPSFARRGEAPASEQGTDLKDDYFPDPNLRGRGRTVETQGGGLAVLRALWELSRQTV
ncbi:hypothetical protein B0H66DRAFT_31517 [Apodospora peruviana]|uniref:Glycosyl hydrolase n=1 Tax=Apodospora peruviana TaxID=516989 RepID=A0AAE0MEH4_9PEZI|nr:hypothetical protein B0H66DRAFT_31517 [Apodospora peruviana]